MELEATKANLERERNAVAEKEQQLKTQLDEFLKEKSKWNEEKLALKIEQDKLRREKKAFEDELAANAANANVRLKIPFLNTHHSNYLPHTEGTGAFLFQRCSHS